MLYMLIIPVKQRLNVNELKFRWRNKVRFYMNHGDMIFQPIEPGEKYSSPNK